MADESLQFGAGGLTDTFQHRAPGPNDNPFLRFFLDINCRSNINQVRPAPFPFVNRDGSSMFQRRFEQRSGLTCAAATRGNRAAVAPPAMASAIAMTSGTRLTRGLLVIYPPDAADPALRRIHG